MTFRFRFIKIAAKIITFFQKTDDFCIFTAIIQHRVRRQFPAVLFVNQR